MRRACAVIALMLVLAGCQRAAEEPVAVVEPLELDCDLIFPPPPSGVDQ